MTTVANEPVALGRQKSVDKFIVTISFVSNHRKGVSLQQ